jgi:hypothetical protein
MKQRYRQNNQNVPDLNSNISKSMTHHSQSMKLTTWFLNLPLDESIDNKNHKVQSLNPKPHEAPLEDQKAKKSSRRSSRRRKNYKANKSTKSGKLSKITKKS